MKAWTYFLTAGIGGVFGFAAGYFLSKRKYEQIADNEIDEVKKYYLKKQLENEEKFNNVQDVENDKKVDNTVSLVPSRTSDDANKTKYNKIGDDEEVLAEKESPEEDMPTKPYFITEEEFSNDMNDYEKISLTYYTIDDTLADDYGEMVDIEETISSDIFNELGSINEDLYVRNPTLETDYEIMHINGSYVDRYMQ